jgi:hypothetical protein
VIQKFDLIVIEISLVQITIYSARQGHSAQHSEGRSKAQALYQGTTSRAVTAEKNDGLQRVCEN